MRGLSRSSLKRMFSSLRRLSFRSAIDCFFVRLSLRSS